MKSNVQKAIMRRVYYSYLVDLVSQSMFWQGMFLSVSGVLLARWLHVASIVHNFLSVPVGGALQYLVSSFLWAVTHGELLTAVLLVVAGFVGLSVGHRLAQVFVLCTRRWIFRF